MKKNTTTIKTVVVMAGNTVHDRPTDTHTHTQRNVTSNLQLTRYETR